jgi:hypothetical protein
LSLFGKKHSSPAELAGLLPQKQGRFVTAPYRA